MEEDEDNETPRHLLMKFISGPAPVSKTPFPPVMEPKKQKGSSKTYPHRKSTGETPRTLLKEVLEEKIKRNSSVLHTDQLSEMELLGSHRRKSSVPISNVLSSESSDLEVSGEEIMSPRTTRKLRTIKASERKRKKTLERESLERELRFTESESSDANLQLASSSRTRHSPRETSSKGRHASSVTASPKSVAHTSTSSGKRRNKHKLNASTESDATDDERSSVGSERKLSKKSSVALVGTVAASPKSNLNTTFNTGTPLRSRVSSARKRSYHHGESPVKSVPVTNLLDAVSSARKDQNIQASPRSVRHSAQLPRIEALRRETAATPASISGSFKSLSSMTNDESDYEERVDEMGESNATSAKLVAARTPDKHAETGTPNKRATTGTPNKCATTGTPNKRAMTGTPNTSAKTATPDMLVTRRHSKSGTSVSNSAVHSSIRKSDAGRLEGAISRSPLAKPRNKLAYVSGDGESLNAEGRDRSGRQSQSKQMVSSGHEYSESEDKQHEAHSPVRENRSAKQVSEQSRHSSSTPQSKHSRISHIDGDIIDSSSVRETIFDEQSVSSHKTSKRALRIESDEDSEGPASEKSSIIVNKSKGRVHRSQRGSESFIVDEVTPGKLDAAKQRVSGASQLSRVKDYFDPMMADADVYDQAESSSHSKGKFSKSKRIDLEEDTSEPATAKDISARHRLLKSHDGSKSVRVPSGASKSHHSSPSSSQMESETTQPYDDEDRAVSPSPKKRRRSVKYVSEDSDRDTEPLSEGDEAIPPYVGTVGSAKQLRTSKSVHDSPQKTKQTKIDAFTTPARAVDSEADSVESELLPLAERVSRRLTAARSLAVNMTKELSQARLERSSTHARSDLGQASLSTRHSMPDTHTPTKRKADLETSKTKSPLPGTSVQARNASVERLVDRRSQTPGADELTDISKRKKSKLHSSPIQKDHSKSQSIMSLGISPIRETEEPISDEEPEVSVRQKTLPGTGKSRLRDKSADKSKQLEKTAETSRRVSKRKSMSSPQPGPSGFYREHSSARRSRSSLQPPKQTTAKSKGPFRAQTPTLPVSLARSIIQNFSGFPVLPTAEPILEECIEAFWDKTMSTLKAYACHAGRDTIEKPDVELYLHRLGLARDRSSMNALVEKYLPYEMRCEVIPMAIAGNKIIP